MKNESEDRLMADAARLARDIAPERDLWPEIEAVITRPVRRSRAPHLAQAAAVLLLVAGSSFLTWHVTKTEPTVVQVPVNDSLQLERASFGANYELGNGFTMARSDLRSQLDEELAKLSSESRAGVEENLKVIRDAIAEINAALEKEPGNALLQEMLLNTYREELAVMRHVGGLTQDVMSRNDI